MLFRVHTAMHTSSDHADLHDWTLEVFDVLYSIVFAIQRKVIPHSRQFSHCLCSISRLLPATLPRRRPQTASGIGYPG